MPADGGNVTVLHDPRRSDATPPNPKELHMAEVGKAAPEFKLKSHDGSEVSLSQYRDSKWLVISAYPFAFTGG